MLSRDHLLHQFDQNLSHLGERNVPLNTNGRFNPDQITTLVTSVQHLELSVFPNIPRITSDYVKNLCRHPKIP